MTHRVEVAPAAIRQLRELDPAARRRIQAVTELSAQQPRPSGAKKLAGGPVSGGFARATTESSTGSTTT